jgi:hypothetical protein
VIRFYTEANAEVPTVGLYRPAGRDTVVYLTAGQNAPPNNGKPPYYFLVQPVLQRAKQPVPAQRRP